MLHHYSSFIILINESTSRFFHVQRVLRQGCPLSPLLFILIMEGLNCLISVEHLLGHIQSIKITNSCTLTHLLSIDDVLIFFNGGIGDLTNLHSIMLLFSVATRMECNARKSTITTSRCSPYEIQYALYRFPFTLQSSDDGLKYLSFRLKPLHYKIVRWTWLVVKIECGLNIWHHRYLSRASPVVLIKSILEATPVYWMSMAWIPRGILMRNQILYCRFIRKGR